MTTTEALPERLAREAVTSLGAPLNERYISVSVDELREHEAAVAAAIRAALTEAAKVAYSKTTHVCGFSDCADCEAKRIAAAIEALKG